MQEQFEFNMQPVAQGLVDVEDLGYFAIEASNDEGLYYYIIVRTLLGTTTIATCGPVMPDVNMLPSGFKVTLDKIPYKEDKISLTVKKWLNDRSRLITQAHPIDVEDAIEQFRDVGAYLRDYSEDTF